MNGWTRDDLMTKPCAKLNGHVLDLQPLLTRRTRKPCDVPDLHESKLQHKCEAYMESRGFHRLTARNAKEEARGWFGHLHKPEGNPFLPDLMVFHEPNNRPALLLELKTVDHFQPGQREMIERGAWTLCWSFAEFVGVFEAWLKKGPCTRQGGGR
jgi:hypothetical protein